jgi:hypothetical protein
LDGVIEMKELERFWNASLEEMKRGYWEDLDQYGCLLCGYKIEKGIVYQDEDLLYEAEKFIKVHIQKTQGLLQLFYQGKSNAEVQSAMGIGSSATIRNHRFVLKEKARQAKAFLAIMELLMGRDQSSIIDYSPPNSNNTSSVIIGRFNLTRNEIDKILKKSFPEGTDGHLKTYDLKHKSRLVILWEVTKRFEADRTYSEKEVNEILKTVYDDYATIRRHLIEYGFMDRKLDGSEYWLKDLNGDEEENMERKKELKQLYKEIKSEGGVYQIRNTINQKVLVVTTPNLKTINGRRRQLEDGSHQNRQLQEELKQFGADAFVFEVLEVLEEKDEGFFDKNDELKKLEKKWLEKLKPYEERGYNK